MKFKDFQAPVLFSSTFKALNLGEKIQVLSRTFKDALEPCTALKEDRFEIYCILLRKPSVTLACSGNMAVTHASRDAGGKMPGMRRNGSTE